jgi:hypothetical protein
VGIKIEKNESKFEIEDEIDAIKSKELNTFFKEIFSKLNQKIRKISLIIKYKEKILKVQNKIMNKKLTISNS